MATLTLLQSTFALLTPLTLTNTLTGLLVLNTDFNSYKTEVASATGTLVKTTDFSNYQTSVAASTAVSALPVVQQASGTYNVVDVLVVADTKEELEEYIAENGLVKIVEKL